MSEPDLLLESSLRAELRGAMVAGSSAGTVNRTHRVVRERARVLQVRRSRARSLWVPLAICSSLLVILCSALWTIFDEYELNPTGVPDASNQIFVLLLWFLPLSAVLLGMVWFRRAAGQNEGEATR